jgi:hypothetical protein
LSVILRTWTPGFIGERIGQCHPGGCTSPKPDGRQRPLAIAALEDKLVQRGAYEGELPGTAAHVICQYSGPFPLARWQRRSSDRPNSAHRDHARAAKWRGTIRFEGFITW